MKRIFKSIIIFLLEVEARIVLWKYKPKIIGITGSVGKTSTKDALYTVLSSKLSIRKNEKSFNTEFGVPLTVLGRPNAWSSVRGWIANLWAGLGLIIWKHDYPKWLILEIGADHPRDIEKLTKWLSLDVGIVTGMGEVPVHVEFFPTIDAVIREKSFVVSAVKPDGFVILNTDAPRVVEMQSSARAKVYTYGFIGNPDFRGNGFKIVYDHEKPTGISFGVEHADKNSFVFIDGTVGMGHAFSVLASVACGELLGLETATIVDVLEKHVATSGRLHLVQGIHGSTIVDDTYNSSPVAVRLALDTLALLIPSGKKIAVLGDMMELGDYSQIEHKKIGEYAKGKVDVLLTLGTRAKGMIDGALRAGFARDAVQSFESREDVIAFLQATVATGDMVLVKGSQSVRMEKIVKSIMAEPSRAKELLVRQDEEWQKR